MAKYYFSKTELDYLLPRQKVSNDLRVQNEALEYLIKSYVLGTVFKRLGLEIKKTPASFDIIAGTIEVEDEPKTDKTESKADKKA